MSTPAIRAALERLIELDKGIQGISGIPVDDWTDAIAAACAALAQSEGEGPTPAEIDKLTQQHTSDLGDLRIGVAPEDAPATMIAASLGISKAEAIAGLHAILARCGRPTAPPVPEAGEGRWSEGVCGDGAAILFDGVMVPIEEVVRALNRTPAAPPAPAEGEVEDLVAWLTMLRDNSTGIATRYDERLTRAATLLRQLSAPAPVVVPVAVSERPILKSSSFNNADGHCWCGTKASVDATGDLDVVLPPSWELREPCSQDDCVLPAHAIPLPQAGEAEG